MHARRLIRYMARMAFIPQSEYTLHGVRSSGPGGQNVNKVSTKVELRWPLGASRFFTDEEKERLRIKLKNRLTARDELVITADNTRSQAQNRALAVERLHDLVRAALAVPKKRRPTKPTAAMRERRLRQKKITSERKRRRRTVEPGE